MADCRYVRAEFSDLVKGLLTEGARERVAGHLEDCAACKDEFQLLQMAWETLPDDDPLVPPDGVRQQILAYAGQQAAVLGKEPGPMRDGWKRRAGPAAIGSVIALALVQLIRLRGAVGALGPVAITLLSLSFAALLAVAAGGLFRSSLPHGARTTLTGALGALGGYFLLTLVLPATDTVHICGEFVFGNIRMSLGQLCSVYLFVTAFYAGIPMAVVAYASNGTGTRGRGVTEAIVFALLTAPLLLLQAGFDIWLIPLSVVAGFAVGAMLGELAGHRARLWVLGTA